MKAAEKVREQFDRWQRGEIDKFEFYAATMGRRVSTVAEATGIDPDVIRDRRRYLRQLADVIPADVIRDRRQHLRQLAADI